MRISGTSPTIGLRSGVKDSGPQKSFFAPHSSESGTRAIARSRKGASRSQSGSSSPNEKSSGTRGTLHAAASVSKRPTWRREGEVDVEGEGEGKGEGEGDGEVVVAGTHHEPAALGTDVGACGRIFDDGPRWIDLGHRLGQQIVVLRRLVGDGHARELAKLS